MIINECYTLAYYEKIAGCIFIGMICAGVILLRLAYKIINKRG